MSNYTRRGLVDDDEDGASAPSAPSRRDSHEVGKKPAALNGAPVAREDQIGEAKKPRNEEMKKPAAAANVAKAQATTPDPMADEIAKEKEKARRQLQMAPGVARAPAVEDRDDGDEPTEDELAKMQAMSGGKSNGDARLGAVSVRPTTARATSFEDPEDFISIDETEKEEKVVAHEGVPPKPDESAVAINATLVGDEEDVEAQVQARVRQETDDIAAAVQRRILDQAVMADVMEPQDENKGPPEPESWCTTKKWIIGLIILVVLGGVGAALGVVFGGGGDDGPSPTTPPGPTPVPTPPPTTPAPTPVPTPAPTGRVDILRALLEEEFPDAPFDDPNSPQTRALEWMALEDPLQLTLQTATFQQIMERYVVVVLYYSTNGAQWTNQYNFLTSTPVCTWNDGTSGTSRQGVFCDSRGSETDDVTNIILNENNLIGIFPTELTSVEGLVKIDLQDNSLGGTIPDSIGRLQLLEEFRVDDSSMSGTIPSAMFELQRLEVVVLEGNGFTGTIPDNIGNAKRLNFFWLHNCQKLAGSIPDSITQITTLERLGLANILLTGTIPEFTSPNLRILGLEENTFSGTIPASLGRLRDLEVFSLSNNFLRGTIPDLSAATSLTHVWLFNNQLTGNIERLAWTTDIPGLKEFDLGTNRLTGTIPTLIGRFTDLVDFRLRENSFRGTLPTEIGLLTKMEEFMTFFSNQLTGTIPTEFGLLTRLSVLDFSVNQLRGTIPSELGRLQRATALGFNANQLIGTVPTVLAALPNLEILLLAVNSFVGSLDPFFCARSTPFDTFWADCLGTPPEIECPCCSHCCNDASNTCEEV